jgi:hypothetical protein
VRLVSATNIARGAVEFVFYEGADYCAKVLRSDLLADDQYENPEYLRLQFTKITREAAMDLAFTRLKRSEAKLLDEAAHLRPDLFKVTA